MVDVTLESVEEGAIVELLGGNVGDAWPCTICAGLFDNTLDERVNDEVGLRYFDVLLKVEKREL